MDNILASFRDPAGFVFSFEGILFRQINQVYGKTYEHLMTSGLYKELNEKNLLIPHVEEPLSQKNENQYKIIKPEHVSTITYPYEWSFGMLKDAALLTLKINQIALKYGMILKDANPYNVQFAKGKPIFIDTLSFEIYQSNCIWQAYKQFCENFLAPLVLMSYTDISLNRILILEPNGVPLAIATKLLPFKSRFNLGIFLHLFFHAKLGKKSELKKQNILKQTVPTNLNQIFENLVSTIEKLELKPKKTNWNNYYTENVTKEYLIKKRTIFEDFISKTNSKLIIDLGANDGEFSAIASKYVSDKVISIDNDSYCVENNYLFIKKMSNTQILPLVMDLTNPSPGIGWANLERTSFWERVKPDTLVALALIHHLCITNYLPLDFVASFFAQKTNFLIIEFVPKEDEKVQILLKNIQRGFDEYTKEAFIKSFSKYFKIIEESILYPTNRILFLMQCHDK